MERITIKIEPDDEVAECSIRLDTDVKQEDNDCPTEKTCFPIAITDIKVETDETANGGDCVYNITDGADVGLVEVQIKNEVEDTTVDTATSSLPCKVDQLTKDEATETTAHVISTSSASVELENRPQVKKRYKCTVCAKPFKEKNEFLLHNASHESKPVKCKQCNYRCTNRDELLIHVMKKHWENQRYKCGECGSLWPNKYSLSTHRTVHTKFKAYKCHICDESFIQQRSLSNHILAHSGIKPSYRCKLCPKTYRISTSLKKHLLSCHPKESL